MVPASRQRLGTVQVGTLEAGPCVQVFALEVAFRRDQDSPERGRVELGQPHADKKMSVAAICQTLNIPRPTLYRWLALK
jgi:Homeodomain-like domain